MSVIEGFKQPFASVAVRRLIDFDSSTFFKLALR